MMTCKERAEKGIYMTVDYLSGRPDRGMTITLYHKDGRRKGSQLLNEKDIQGLWETLNEILNGPRQPDNVFILGDKVVNLDAEDHQTGGEAGVS